MHSRMTLTATARLAAPRFSTKAAASIKAPKKIYGTHGRYAEATYIAASKASLLDKVASELGAFKAVMGKSPNFASFLANPSVPRGEKMTKIGALLAEDKISFVTRNLFVTLAANGRIGESDKVRGGAGSKNCGQYICLCLGGGGRRPDRYLDIV